MSSFDIDPNAGLALAKAVKKTFKVPKVPKYMGGRTRTSIRNELSVIDRRLARSSKGKW